ncbi:MAG: acyl-CoA dehydrogenase family protein [Deltaproteobacteria bacterium]|nr:acyl-CoA dehydrogenase family protein [Deltaproteobacteria bacterium]
MSNFYTDNDDLRFYVERAIPWAEILAASRRGEGAAAGLPASAMAESVSLYRDLLDAIGDFVGNDVAPQVAAVDRDGVRFEAGEVIHPPRLDRICRAMNERELHRLSLPAELGGLEAPFLVYLIACELFSRADPATMTHFGFHGGIAMALLLFSIREGTTRFDPVTGQITETRFREAIDEIAAGRAWGSMDITEPDCGSDMAKLRTRAVRGADGVWRLTGQKIFITSGHGKYHVVIARTGRDPSLPPSKKTGDLAGLDELGLFVVPAWSEVDGRRERTVKLIRAEDKLGHHASATMAVGFDESPGELVGKAGEGFAYMLHMMNSARVGVGFEGVGLIEATSRQAHAYAAQRHSMGKTIDRHEMIADMLDELRADVIGLRALAMRAGLHEELAQKLELRARVMPATALADERALRRHRKKARELTPLLKYLTAEQAVLHARRNLQIHGGVGYTTDYGAEKLYRDAAVLPIYEGTSQIQALMVMKDRLGEAMRAPSDFVRREAEARWRSMSARDPLERAAMRLRTSGLQAMRHLIVKTATNKLVGLRGRPMASWPGALTRGWDPKRDFAWALLHAERLTRILADGAVADALLEQARAFPDEPSRRAALESHLERAEPRARHLLDMITSTGGRLLAQLRGGARDEGGEASG